MRTHQQIKDLIQKYRIMSESQQRTRVAEIIENEKRMLVEKQDYVGILYILQVITDYEKNALFKQLLDRYPDSSLFVLAFGSSDMDSYSRAYQIETLENDEEALSDDVELTMDSMLCRFLSSHHTKDDLNYINTLIDGATWMDAYKKVTDFS